jgi:transposase
MHGEIADDPEFTDDVYYMDVCSFRAGLDMYGSMGMSERGVPCVEAQPSERGDTYSLICVINRRRGVVARHVFKGHANAEIIILFLQRFLLPVLPAGSMLVADGASYWKCASLCRRRAASARRRPTRRRRRAAAATSTAAPHTHSRSARATSRRGKHVAVPRIKPMLQTAQVDLLYLPARSPRCTPARYATRPTRTPRPRDRALRPRAPVRLNPIEKVFGILKRALRADYRFDERSIMTGIYAQVDSVSPGLCSAFIDALYPRA